MSRHGKPGRDRQTIEAVRLGLAAPHRVERVFQKRLDAHDVGGLAVGARHQEIVQRDGFRLAVFRQRTERKGLLGDHLEPEILEHRQAIGERDKASPHEQLQAQRAFGIARLSVDMRGDRSGAAFALQHRFDAADVGHGIGRRDRFAIVAGKGVRVAADQPAREFAMIEAHRLGETVLPGADRRPDVRLQRFDVHIRPPARDCVRRCNGCAPATRRRASASPPTAGRRRLGPAARGCAPRTAPL